MYRAIAADLDGHILSTRKLGIRRPFMERNEILLEAKKVPRGKENERIEEKKSTLLGGFVALVVGLILFCFELFRKGSINWSVLAIMMTASAVQALYEGIKLKRIPWIVYGSLQAVVALFAFLAAIFYMVNIL